MGCFELTILSDLMEATEINKTLSVSNQTPIFIQLCALFPGYEISPLIHSLSTLSSTCIAYFEKELGETLHVRYSVSVLSVLDREGERERKIRSHLSDDLPLQRRYLSSVLRLLSLMGQK